MLIHDSHLFFLNLPTQSLEPSMAYWRHTPPKTLNGHSTLTPHNTPRNCTNTTKLTNFPQSAQDSA